MADWLTHVLLGWAALELISLKYSNVLKYRFIVLIGSVLPDLGNVTMFMGETGSYLSYYFTPFHAPLGIILLIIPIFFIARKNHQKKVFFLLMLGVCLHLAADYLIITLTGKLPLLFPFIFKRFGYGIFLQGGWAFLILAGLLAVLFTIIRILKKRTELSKKLILPNQKHRNPMESS